MNTDSVTDVYGLSPMQQGMLLHTAYAHLPGVDIEQAVGLLREPIDTAILERAWNDAIQRHPALRTGFRWEGREFPVQEVAASAPVTLDYMDWTHLSSHESVQQLEAFLAADRARGFRLGRPPLVRVALFRTGQEEYRFVWTCHHLILDARAIAMVLQEVFAAYDALVEGRQPSPLTRRPYRDFIDWLQIQDWSRAQAFWRARWKIAMPQLKMASGGHESTCGLDASPGRKELALDAETTSSLRRFAAGNRITLNTMFQGAWAITLSHFTGSSEISFGAVRACRRSSIEGAASMIGMLINTVPMRVTISNDRQVTRWLGDLRKEWLALREFEHTPLAKIEEWCGLPGNPPLFDSIFNFQDPAWDASLYTQGGRWANRSFDLLGQSNYPLAMDISAGASIRVQLHYRCDRIDANTASRLLAHWKMTLLSFVSEPRAKLHALPLLDDADRAKVMLSWNDTVVDFPRGKTVHQMFEEQAVKTPKSVAVADDRRQLSYAELNSEADMLAGSLRRMGVGPDVAAAVCIDRSVDMVVAQLAILKSGGAYLPIDPSNPAERIAFMVRDSASPVVLTQRSLMKELESMLPEAKVICAAGVVRDLPQASQPNSPKPEPGRSAAAQNLAYIIYTSGSTGVPKGVEVEHASLINLITWHQRTYRVTPVDRAVQVASPGFDASVWEVWPYLTAGASVHIPDEETRLSPRKLIAWLASRRISLAFAPTPLAEAMLAETWPENIAMRVLLTGGDRLHRAPSWKHRFSIVNHYGPTENTVVATSCVISEEGCGRDTPPIGRPISNVTVFVVDSLMRPVPIGVPGELLIGGGGLARGYRNRPELTKTKFIANPFESKCGDRLYRTGDLVRFLPDGNLAFIGRMDNQVKLRGHRIELGEVEAVLSRHPGVRESVVVLQECDHAAELVAFFVPVTSEVPTGAELADFLSSRLPGSMVPSAFAVLDAVPLTPNGKVDRKALPAVVPNSTADAGPTEPRNATEAALAGMWVEVLGVGRVGIHDNFFSIGGHSLRAARVIARVRDLLGVDLELKKFFEFPTIARLAAIIDHTERSAARQVAVSVDDRSSASQPALSFAQERLWFLAQMENEPAQNNVPLAFRLEGSLNAPLLEQALGEIVRRHEPLRTIFLNSDGVPLARIVPWEPFRLELLDLEHNSQTDRTVETDRIASDEARRPFDLTRSPLVRGRLLRWDANNHVLLLTLHHIACDGWSVGVLNRELAAIYDSLCAGRTASVTELSSRYSDFADWQRREFEGRRLNGHLEFWNDRLGGEIPALDLPTDRPRPEVQSHRGTLRQFVVPAALTSRLAHLCRREEVTLYMLLLATLQTLLHRYTGQTDILIGSPVGGRQRADSEGLIGLFLNTIVMRGDLSGDPPFRELLKRTRQRALESFAHQDVPFEKLVEILKPGRDLSRSPLFQVMFVLQNEPRPPLELSGIEATQMAAHSGTAKYDLTLSLEERDGKIAGEVEYSTDLFDEATISRMVKHFTTLLTDIAANPERQISELRLLARDEQHNLLVTWNQTSMDYPVDACVHHMIREQAARTPNAVALVFEGVEMTYNELDVQSDCLASELQSMGVRPEVRVGVCLDRSIEMMVGLLAILKAGGAYVPLDPSYPKERLSVIAEDAQISLLITRKKLLQSLSRNRSRIIFIEELDKRKPVSDLSLLNRGSGDNLAYVLYTSGSTGRPKGVMITHRNVVNFFCAMDQVLGRVPGVWLAVTSISFDISVLELFWTLARGFKVVMHRGASPNPSPVAERAIAPGPNRPAVRRVGSQSDEHSIAAEIVRHRVSHLQCTPSLAEMMIQDRATAAALKSLTTLLLGGEALSAALVEKLPDALQIFNMYGPTETTVWSAAYEVERGESSIPIGRPLANTQIYILDAKRHPVPAGIVGELYIGGDGVGRGYWNLPVLTAERFVRDPFARNSQRRLYRTGDLARFRPSGVVEFLGRSDQQVKLRGFRVELTEIEITMRRHPAVRECAVKVWEPAPGDRRLVGYVVPVPGKAFDPDALRQFVANALPGYMVPSTFASLNALPLTPNGKLDRRALPEPEVKATPGEIAYRAPESDLEKTIARIWRECLRVERVGRHDNFFDLGGHSLLLVQVQARLEQALGNEISVTTLFQYPTIAALAGSFGPVGKTSVSFERARSRGRRQQAAFTGAKEGVTA